jgi:class 3 adenylate cyclase/pimeloyl-ACP methyl ester carboxylesterase
VEPKVRYARSGDVDIAYAVFGAGPIDVVIIPGFVSALDLVLEGVLSGLIETLSPLARVITFDKRGTGLSDRVSALPNIETRMDDLRAVMDAAESERAHLLGVSEGGPMSMLFAATFPERVLSLGLYGTFASFVRTDDQPWMPTTEERDAVNAVLNERWGSGRSLSFFLPRDELTEETFELLARFETRSATPRAVVTLNQMNAEIDVRTVIGSIAVPTLIVHPTADRIIPVESARYLAQNIPGARLIETTLANHVSTRPDWTNEWSGDYIEFITGTKPEPAIDRVLSTVLFTDIVDSTRVAVSQGDAAWKDLLDRHDSVMRREVERFRGTLVKHTGDGVLARFDGPARAVSCGLAAADRVKALGINVRTGVHTGEVELRGDDIGGIAVHVGARVMAMAGAGEVLVTRTVRDLTAGSGLTFTDRGEHELKGVPERWQVFQAS